MPKLKILAFLWIIPIIIVIIIVIVSIVIIRMSILF